MKRIISRLDIKGQNVIKGVHLEGLKIIGDPEELSRKYSNDGADEIYFHDTVASLYERNNLFELVERVASNISIPLTVSGGLKKVEDIEKALISGADKVSLNTIFHKDISLISKIVRIFGAQAIVGSIEAKKINNEWVAFTDNGRTNTKKNVLEWVKKLQDEGIGEIVVTSVDFEGTQKGFDLELLNNLNLIVKVPLILSGGIGNIGDIEIVFKIPCYSGVTISSVLHYDKLKISEIKNRNSKIKEIKKINIIKQNKKITVLKSKICNIKSLTNSLKKVADFEIVDNFNPKKIDKLILPGVGSFSEFAKGIRDDQKNSIIEFSKLNKPILGICLGAQFLFSKSFEHGNFDGLNLISGNVINIKDIEKKKNILSPNIGWYEIEKIDNKLFKDIPDRSKFYFIHSYNFQPADKKILTSKIINSNINAVCIKNNLIACQFHPEKSGEIGIKFLENFVKDKD